MREMFILYDVYDGSRIGCSLRIPMDKFKARLDQTLPMSRDEIIERLADDREEEILRRIGHEVLHGFLGGRGLPVGWHLINKDPTHD